MSSIEKAAARLNEKKAQTEVSGSETESPKSAKKRAPRGGEVSIETQISNGIIKPPKGVLAEQYRMIKRRVRANITSERVNANAPNLVMVTSALPREGKTFNALNLALSMSKEMDHTVLLIDADLVKRSLSQILAVGDRPGLTDILAGKATFPEVLKWTDVPKLAVLPAGSVESNATEMLASEKMRQFTTELSSRYKDRIIIFDAPPLLATSHAAVLSGLMGQVLFVVAQGITPQHAVQEAVSLLSSEPNAGFIFNMAVGGLDSYYGHYYAESRQAS